MDELFTSVEFEELEREVMSGDLSSGAFFRQNSKEMYMCLGIFISTFVILYLWKPKWIRKKTLIEKNATVDRWKLVGFTLVIGLLGSVIVVMVQKRRESFI